MIANNLVDTQEDQVIHLCCYLHRVKKLLNSLIGYGGILTKTRVTISNALICLSTKDKCKEFTSTL